MQKLTQRIKLLFFISLGLSIGFPLGILGIIFGAVYKLTVLLVFGIIFTVAGFYVMPILWVRYGERRQDRTLLIMIENEHLYTVSALAAQTGYSEKTVRDKISKLILSRFLVGYLFKNDVLELNTNKEQAATNHSNKKCTCCGASMIFDGLKFRCEYCGSIENAE